MYGYTCHVDARATAKHDDGARNPRLKSNPPSKHLRTTSWAQPYEGKENEALYQPHEKHQVKKKQHHRECAAGPPNRTHNR
jgi:hypothetical protein